MIYLDKSYHGAKMKTRSNTPRGAEMKTVDN